MTAFREATWDEVLPLRRRCFPDDEIEDKPRPTRMFVAEEEGRPIAHLGFIPQTYVIGGHEYAGALAVDAMTDPEYRRQGLFRRVAAFARDAIRVDYALSTAWQIRPAVLGSMIATGWRPILRAPVFMRPILFHRAPSPRRGGERVGVRGGAKYAYVKRAPDRFAQPYYSANPTCTTRETTLKGIPTLAILDFTTKPILPETTARLAAALVTWRHPLLPQLLRAGFLPSPYRFRFLVNAFDSRIDPAKERWALTWADTDHL